MGGVATAELLVTPTGGSVKNIDLLRGLEHVASGAKAYRDPEDGAQVVMHALSLVDIAKRRGAHYPTVIPLRTVCPTISSRPMKFLNSLGSKVRRSSRR